jgi:general secretion pathway protein G
LIELLMVIAIILTIAAIAVPSLLAAIDASKVARAAGDIRAIEDDIALYEVMNNKLPNTLAEAGDGALLDPWHNAYQYLNHTGVKGMGGFRKDRFLVPLNDDYDLYSMGKDGQTAAPITAKASQDDIIRAGSGSYIGLASQF